MLKSLLMTGVFKTLFGRGRRRGGSLRSAILVGVGLWAGRKLMESYNRKKTAGRKLDEVSEDSFPASDPPSWSGTSIR